MPTCSESRTTRSALPKEEATTIWRMHGAPQAPLTITQSNRRLKWESPHQIIESEVPKEWEIFKIEMPVLPWLDPDRMKPKRLSVRRGLKAQWRWSYNPKILIAEMFQGQDSMKQLRQQNLWWNQCHLGWWALQRDLPQVCQKINLDNRAQLNIPLIMRLLISKQPHMYLVRRAASLQHPKMSYFSLDPAHIHFLLNINSRSLLWASSLVTAKRL